MPVLGAGGDGDHHAGRQLHGSHAPFLIPSAAVDADQHLHGVVVHMPVVAAAGLEGDVAEAADGVEHGQVALPDEVFGVGVVGLAQRIGRGRHDLLLALHGGYGGLTAQCFRHETGISQRHGDGGKLFLADAHIQGTAHMGLQLRHHAFKAAEGADSHQLSVGIGQHVAGEDVAEKVCFEVVVLGWAELIVEGLAAEPGLHLGALLEGVVARGQGRGLGTHLHVAVLFHHLLQGSQGVERTGKSGVGIELREGLLHLVGGEARLEALVDGACERRLVAARLVACDDGHRRRLLLVESQFSHILVSFACLAAAGRHHDGCQRDKCSKIQLLHFYDN